MFGCYCCCCNTFFFASFLIATFVCVRYKRVYYRSLRCVMRKDYVNRESLCLCEWVFAHAAILFGAYAFVRLYVCMVNTKWSDKDEIVVLERRRKRRRRRNNIFEDDDEKHKKQDTNTSARARKICRWWLRLWAEASSEVRNGALTLTTHSHWIS